MNEMETAAELRHLIKHLQAEVKAVEAVSGKPPTPKADLCPRHRSLYGARERYRYAQTPDGDPAARAARAAQGGPGPDQLQRLQAGLFRRCRGYDYLNRRALRCRQSHGATGCAGAHSPRRPALPFASSTAITGLGAYCAQSYAASALTITSLVSMP